MFNTDVSAPTADLHKCPLSSEVFLLLEVAGAGELRGWGAALLLNVINELNYDPIPGTFSLTLQ